VGCKNIVYEFKQISFTTENELSEYITISLNNIYFDSIEVIHIIKEMQVVFSWKEKKVFKNSDKNYIMYNMIILIIINYAYKMFVDVDFNRVLNHSMINENTKKKYCQLLLKKDI